MVPPPMQVMGKFYHREAGFSIVLRLDREKKLDYNKV
jgi:hypothetical protein